MSSPQHSVETRRELDRLADHFEGLTDWVVDVQLPAMRDFPSYTGVDGVDLRRSARRNALRLVASLRGEETLSGDAELEQATGRARAAQGIPVDELVGLLRAVYARLGDAVVRTSRELDLSSEATLEGMHRLWRTADRSTADLLTGFHAEQLRAATDRESARASFVTSVLHGALSGSGDGGAALQYGVSPSTRYHVVRTPLPVEEAHGRELRRRLERACRHPDFTPLLVAVDGDLLGISAVVPSSWEGTEPLVVADAVFPADLPDQVGRTLSTLAAARAFGETGVVLASSQSLRGVILDRRDVGATLHTRYLDPLLRRRGGRELVHTLRTYLACGRSVTRSAEELVVHVNTVRYRLERATTLAEIDLAETEQLVELWWALAHHQLVDPHGRG